MTQFSTVLFSEVTGWAGRRWNDTRFVFLNRHQIGTVSYGPFRAQQVAFSTDLAVNSRNLKQSGKAVKLYSSGDEA